MATIDVDNSSDEWCRIDCLKWKMWLGHPCDANH